MDASDERPPTRADEGKPTERKGAPRPPGEGRRKRPAENRYASWGDGINRAICARAEHGLPSAFPVASHAGLATIAPAVVARRPDTLLLCNFSHCGTHEWPDGELVEDAQGEPAEARL